MSKDNIKTLVDRFLTWPLPVTVAADGCATNPNYAFPRSGTNLLTAKEAEAMLVYVLGLEDEFSLDVQSKTCAPPPASTNRMTDGPTDTELGMWQQFDGSFSGLRELFDHETLAAMRADPAYGWERIKERDDRSKQAIHQWRTRFGDDVWQDVPAGQFEGIGPSFRRIVYAAPITDSAMAKDADRYRWLRRDRTEDQARQIIDMLLDNCEEHLDEAIDAAAPPSLKPATESVDKPMDRLASEQIEQRADETSCTNGYSVEDGTGAAHDHWWTFEREGLHNFARTIIASTEAK